MQDASDPGQRAVMWSFSYASRRMIPKLKPLIQYRRILTTIDNDLMILATVAASGG